MTLKVDRDRFLNEGYLILRGVIPRGDLSHLRAHCESLLEMQKVKWAADRGPDDPPGGAWEMGAQPRLVHFEKLIDQETATAVEFCLGETTLGASRQIMGAPDAAPTLQMMMCSPVRDWLGGTGWHRDGQPVDMAPLDALSADFT